MQIKLLGVMVALPHGTGKDVKFWYLLKVKKLRRQKQLGQIMLAQMSLLLKLKMGGQMLM